MTYEKLVEKVKKAYAKADASKISEHVAIQVDVTGEAHGAFYIEVAEGNINVEPYDYHDHDMIVTSDEKAISDIAAGKVTFEKAVNTSKISVSGPNFHKAIELLDSISFEKKEVAKKATAKKTETKAATKKATAKKTEAKAPAKKAETVKVEAPKAEAKKVEAPKAAATVKAAEVKKEAPKAEAKKAPAKKTAKKSK